jgi:2',3'-cyclic-nucleotide 2'-phosphodiesterase (5'-nucleotidase family)
MRPEPRPAVRRILAGILVVGAVAIGVAWFDRADVVPELAAAPEPAKAEPQVVFDRFPPNRKPDLVIVLSGQMHGYLQKCGCSHPQKGGLERRFNFIESLKSRGWEVIGIDVGDIPHPLPYTPTNQQTLAKYEVAMQAMKVMGYKATTVGHEELAMPLLDALTKYTVQKGNEYPKVHAANIDNPEDFPGGEGGSALTKSDVIATKSGIKVGVVGVAGAEVVQKGTDRTVRFSPNAGKVVDGILKGWEKGGPDVNVLLYQGPLDWTEPGSGKKVDAKTAAEAFPQFHIVLCKTPEGSDAPDNPTVVEHKDPKTGKVTGSTMICEVGQRGQNVGVVGIFKGEKGETNVYYQRVVMGEEFETPPEKEAGHPLLKLLQDYSDSVRDNDYLSEMARRKKLHSVQALPKHNNATYVGDTQCQVCHQAEFGVWQKTKHAGAYNALAVVAKHPTGRNFDGECIICHTVGYDFKTGYLNQKTTPNLTNVQCESCHGPSSLHVDEETANLGKKKGQTHDLLAALSPWKVNRQGAMPSLEKLEVMTKENDARKRETILNPAEHQLFLRVFEMCYKCHDLDNDPHFRLETYWPKVVHTGLKKK